MADYPSTKEILQRVIESAYERLEKIEYSPFSPHAFSTLKYKISEYIVQLVSESIKVSKRRRADTVSAAHVEQASEYLVSSTSRRFFKLLGIFGGIFFGGSLSAFLAMVVTGNYSFWTGFASAGLAVLGSSMIVLHITME